MGIACPILAQYDMAFEATRRATHGEQGRLYVGTTSAFHPILPLAIHSFRNAFPQVDLTLEERLPSDLIALLKDEKIDVALLRADTFKESGSPSGPFWQSQ
jgi:DNA-binding transcriptional LysR family regulator